MMKKRIFITGGNGFIGSHIVRELVHSGREVTCLVRKGSSARKFDGVNAAIVRGDLADTAVLAGLVTGHDAVIHTAGLVNDWSRYDEFYRVNVEGTLNVLEACRAAGIEQVIHTGTCSSYGEEHNFSVKDEHWPDASHRPYFADRLFPCRMNHYRDTKALATLRATAFAEEHGMNLTVLEPAFVYGEREFSTGFYEYVKSAGRGIPVAPGSRHNLFPVIYAGDLARAYRLALEKKLPGVNRILIANPEPELLDRILNAFCRHAGVKKPLPLPKWSLYGPAMLLELLYTLLHSLRPPVLTRGRVCMFTDNVAFSSDKAERLLDFTADTPLDEGIKRTVEWYRANGFL